MHVADAARRGSLTQEPLDDPWLFGRIRMEHLEGAVVLGDLVLDFVNEPHSACAEGADDAQLAGNESSGRQRGEFVQGSAPVRLAELGTVYRYERSGVLHGLMRVRGFTQDDAHIFCMPSQIESEVEACVDFAFAVMKNFGFDKFEVELSDWDAAHPENYAGKPEDWRRATAALADTMKRMNIPYKKIEGEAAFYGPKIDVKLIDAIGRPWQLTTVQFDFNLPARFGLEYVGEDGARHQPLMVHRALLGSVERFFGILIEHYAGAFPLWLAPVQAEVCPVSEKVIDYAKHVTETLKRHGARVHLDERNEKLPARIRDAQLQKIPYMLVVGAKEAEAGTVSVRHRSKGDLGPKPLAEFVAALQQEIESRATS